MGQFRNKLGHYDADTLRELGKELRRQNITAADCAVGFRISKIPEKLNILEIKKQRNFSAQFLNFHNKSI